MGTNQTKALAFLQLAFWLGETDYKQIIQDRYASQVMECALEKSKLNAQNLSLLLCRLGRGGLSKPRLWGKVCNLLLLLPGLWLRKKKKIRPQMFSNPAWPFDSAVIKCQPIGNQFYFNSRLNVEKTSYFFHLSKFSYGSSKGVSSQRSLPDLPHTNCVSFFFLRLPLRLSLQMLYPVPLYCRWSYVCVGSGLPVKCVLSLEPGALFRAILTVSLALHPQELWNAWYTAPVQLAIDWERDTCVHAEQQRYLICIM